MKSPARIELARGVATAWLFWVTRAKEQGCRAGGHPGRRESLCPRASGQGKR